MNRRKEKKAPMQQNRGFSLMPVAHDGVPIVCAEGVATEVAPDVFVTVDASSGIALVEAGVGGLSDARVKVSINGQHVLDVSQLARGGVLAIDGREYVFLKYMDVYVKPRPLEVVPSNESTEGSVAKKTERPVRPIVVDLNPQRPRASQDKKIDVRRMAIIFGPVVAVLIGACLLLLLPTNQPDIKKGGSETAGQAGTVLHSQPADNEPSNAEEKVAAPQTLRELMAEASPSQIAAEPIKGAQGSDASIPSNAVPATGVKRESTNQVKKKVAVVAPVQKPSKPALSPAALKELEAEYQEAVLIRGYDRDRSVRMLQQLRKKVPAGTALRQKIESSLNQ